MDFKTTASGGFILKTNGEYPYKFLNKVPYTEFKFKPYFLTNIHIGNNHIALNFLSVVRTAILQSLRQVYCTD